MQNRAENSDTELRATSIDIVIPAYNAGPNLERSVAEWLSQNIPDGWIVTIILVDDGSTDGAPERVAENFSVNITVVRHETSRGRAAALNTGADAGVGAYIAFFDADCIPEDSNTISRYINNLQLKTDIAFGRILAHGNDFWAQYFQQISNRRELNFHAGDKTSFTTANCLIKREAFYRLGKFDEGYIRYGFEDRDLLARASILNLNMLFIPDAGVYHCDTLRLASVCKKMRTAGRYSSGKFMLDHPQIYAKMQFARVDVRCDHTILRRLIAQVVRPLLPLIEGVGGAILHTNIPYSIKRAVVKICSGLFFMVGTDDALNDNADLCSVKKV
jgi:glycosyltransferase involved in cell wall biosynthesis